MIDKLTEQLSSKEQNVVLEPLTPREELIERIKNNFVYIKFVNTNGTGTEVGVDLIASNIKELKYNNIKTLIIEGKTRLNFNYILIKASIDLESRKGLAKVCLIDRS
jgi:hypothetical protein